MTYMGNLRQSTEMPLEIKSNSSKVAIPTMNRPKANHAPSRSHKAVIKAVLSESWEFMSELFAVKPQASYLSSLWLTFFMGKMSCGKDKIK